MSEQQVGSRGSSSSREDMRGKSAVPTPALPAFLLVDKKSSLLAS